MKIQHTTSPSFTLAHLSHFQENHGNYTAATSNFINDEVTRLRRKYAVLLDLYHRAQQAETEGIHTVTLQSQTQTVSLALPDFDFWNAIMDPLTKQLGDLEHQIIAMLQDLPARLADFGDIHPEHAAIVALCLPPTEPIAQQPERCPLLPESMVLTPTRA